MELISVILPAYNAEKILPKCLDSILSQTYKVFEIIIVNDGSQDNTGKIANSFAEKDNRIKVVHKENGGVSSARNEGLKVASGYWVTFVDADDWLEDDYLQNMISWPDADIVIGGYRSIGDGEIPEKEYVPCFLHFDEIGGVLKDHMTDMTFLCPWGKLFRREIIQQNHLIFNADMRIGEDTVFVWNYLAMSGCMAFVGGKNYNYQTEKSDFKYAIDAEQSLLAIKRIIGCLELLEIRNKCVLHEAKYFIYNYYIWLYKLYVKKFYSLNRILEVKVYFSHTYISSFYKIYRTKSLDKKIICLLINLRLEILIYFLIKIWY